ncbi:heavy metal translocating P-type ATPase [Microbacterium sp. RURRCA19A]|uniref:heavy metal translocating P-type ATPase n=1 Tax=Microbacterium sp. RURRCA19A TaxID=1907391 RepID=UPI000955C56C|nr:heavy metal translocating P-type ATPase [Microbacterium sp. RURRCA19A]SIR58534.1 heavy metal-(Cd/Co/Hg/Pb/Zn)-translocating P-type ATPase [Microbacterium sp. RURRCA19A]
MTPSAYVLPRPQSSVGGTPQRGVLPPKLLLALSSVVLVVTAWLCGRPDVAQACAATYAVTLAALSGIESVRRLARRQFGVDILATVAIVAALLASEVWAAFIVGLMLATGEGLEKYANWRARKDLRHLLSTVPTRALVVGADGAPEEVRIASVRVGDIVLVRQGEVVPVDAVLLDETATLDESSLTGESLPVEATRDQTIASGAVNLSGLARMRAVRVEADSQYQRIVELVAHAANAKAPTVRLADRVAGPFTLAALAISAAAGALSGDWARAVAVLVVATPCPLIIAAPVAFAGGISRAARERIIVRSGAALEMLSRSRTIAFDKTGTLTSGSASVVDVRSRSAVAPERLLMLAAAADSVSSHVYAEALRRAASQHPTPSAATETPGAGVDAMVEGHHVVLGRAPFVRRGAPTGADDSAPTEGRSVVFVRVDDGPVDEIVLADPPRPGARDTVRTLREEMGQRVLMLSGDDADTARRVADEIGIALVHAPCTPEEKVALVRAQTDRPAVMVGDGINDAPVLASADVGIALGGRRATLASEAADIVLLRDDIADVVRARRYAVRTVTVARQSIVLGVAMSVVLMMIAAFGLLPALAGAWLQEVVDLSTILWALRTAVPPGGEGPRASHE